MPENWTQPHDFYAQLFWNPADISFMTTKLVVRLPLYRGPEFHCKNALAITLLKKPHGRLPEKERKAAVECLHAQANAYITGKAPDDAQKNRALQARGRFMDANYPPSIPGFSEETLSPDVGASHIGLIGLGMSLMDGINVEETDQERWRQILSDKMTALGEWVNAPTLENRPEFLEALFDRVRRLDGYSSL